MHYPGPGTIAIKDFIPVDGINFADIDGIPMHVLICQATFNSMEFIHNFHPINIYCYYMKRMELLLVLVEQSRQDSVEGQKGHVQMSIICPPLEVTR